MDIKDSKYFTTRDLKVIRALGYGTPEVNGDWRNSEEIYLGDSTYLVAKRDDFGDTVYFVNDHECHECYRTATSAVMAMAHYVEGNMVEYSDSPIPDWFWPHDLHSICVRHHQGKNVHVKRFQKYYSDLGNAVVISGDCKRIKIAVNKFSEWDSNEEFFQPLPEEMPSFDEWESVIGKDGKPLEASCEEILNLHSYEEQSRAINIILKGLRDRI